MKKCVRCTDKSLVEKSYEGVDIDCCIDCGGAWLDNTEILDIIRERNITFNSSDIRDVIMGHIAGLPKAEKETILNCPVCSQSLKPINYNYNSGVIIDHCPHGDGLWFDKGELEKVQISSEHWEAKAKELGEDWQAMILKVEGQVHENNDEQIFPDTKNPIKMIVNFLVENIEKHN